MLVCRTSVFVNVRVKSWKTQCILIVGFNNLRSFWGVLKGVSNRHPSRHRATRNIRWIVMNW